MKAGCLRGIAYPLQISYLNLENLLKSSSEISLFHFVQGVIQVFVFSQQYLLTLYKPVGNVPLPTHPHFARVGGGGPRFL